MNNPRVSAVVALFLLSLVFLVITHGPLVHALAWVILNADQNVFKDGVSEVLNAYIAKHEGVALGFSQPQESLEEALDTVAGSSAQSDVAVYQTREDHSNEQTWRSRIDSGVEKANITDEEKEKLRLFDLTVTDGSRPFLDMILSSLDCSENDYLALLGLCLFYSISNNKGVNSQWLEMVLNKSTKSSVKYKFILVERLLSIISMSSETSCRIRLVTLEITLSLLAQFTKPGTASCSLSDVQQQTLFGARNQGMVILRNFYKSEDIFLDLFEDEYNEMVQSQLNVEYLCMDCTILLPPTGTPLTGINFTRRLPCGEVEKARRAIRCFFMLRNICQQYMSEVETLLPLTNLSNCVEVDNVLDLNNSDLIACTVITKDLSKYRRFLVIDALQLILVEPDAKRLGWGIAKLVGFLQDVEVAGDKDDSRCLHITIHRGGATHNRTPILSAKFLFDDHIRCMAARQRLIKGRSKARQKKMFQIAHLLEISDQRQDLLVCTSSALGNALHAKSRENRPLFSTANRVPGFAAALRYEASVTGSLSRVQISPNISTEGTRQVISDHRRYSNSSNSSSQTDVSQREFIPSISSNLPREKVGSRGSQTRENSPSIYRPRSEEIPLDDLQNSRSASPSSRRSIPNALSRSCTPSAKMCEASSSTKVCETVSKLATDSHSKNNVGVNVTKDTSVCSEETSFIDPEEMKKHERVVELV